MIYSLQYTNDIPIGRAGTAKFWFIKIRPEYKVDRGILEHEKVHVWQFWRTLGLHGILMWIKRYKLSAETEAYKEQLCWPPAILSYQYHKRMYAEFIATKYGLDITVEDAYRLLGD